MRLVAIGLAIFTLVAAYLFRPELWWSQSGDHFMNKLVMK
jgi:hypothetical protein